MAGVAISHDPPGGMADRLPGGRYQFGRAAPKRRKEGSILLLDRAKSPHFDTRPHSDAQWVRMCPASWRRGDGQESGTGGPLIDWSRGTTRDTGDHPGPCILKQSVTRRNMPGLDQTSEK